MYIVPKLIGGLGNQLFILAATMDVSIRSNRIIAFHTKPGNFHCSNDKSLAEVFPSIPIICFKNIDGEYAGADYSYKDILAEIDPILNTIFISGYNQHPKYIPAGFCKFIDIIPQQVPYINMNDTAFIHVRRGDYVNHPCYLCNTDVYYRSAVRHLLKQNTNIKVLIVSDDTRWSNKYIIELLNNIIASKNILYLDRDYKPTETLKIMSNCLGGAICANSSFSWWGAYVNKNRPIYMPHPWSSYDTSVNLGLYFEGVTKISDKTGNIL